MIAILFIAMLSPSAHAGWLAGWCERNLVMEDPYQFEHLSVDQLVGVFFLNKNQKFESKALINEMRSRLGSPWLSDEDREVLTKTLENKW